MSSSDEDDPVEQEIDVYLAKTLSENLHLFQYPVRPCNLTYENVPHLSSKFKPGQQKVELELAINTRSPHYSESKGEQIAINVDGPAESENSFYSSGKMDKQVLTSCVALSNVQSYAVGIYKDKELHISPLNDILQLRPSFSYLDKSDSRSKPEVGPGGDTGEGSQDEEEEAKPVRVRFARETEEAKQRRLASYEHKAKLEREEKWVKCTHHQPYNQRAETERMSLYSKTAGVLESGTAFQMSSNDYLTKLIPKFSTLDQEKVALPTNVISLADLKQLPLSDQVKALLTNAKVMRFNQLMGLLPKDADPTAVLRSVQQVAVLVQGCWVIKSEVLYPKESMSAHSGIPAEVLCRVRDYVLLKYTHAHNMSRTEITSVIKVPSDDLKDILEQVSHYKVNHGWSFVFEYDKEFVDRFPEVVQRQQMLWDAKQQQLTKSLSLSLADKKELSKVFPEKAKRRRTTSRSRHKSGERSMSDQSDAEYELAPKSHPASINALQPGSNHKLTNGTLDPDCEILDDTEKQLTEFDIELHKFVRDKLSNRFVLSLSELRRLYTLQMASCPPGHILATGVTDQALEQAVMQCGGTRVKNQWPPGMTEQPLFALEKAGDSLDQIRSVLLAAFTGVSRSKSTAIKKLAEKKGVQVSENDLKKILKDYCISKAGTWYLKFTLPNDSAS